MQDPIIQDNKQESRFRLSVELINGYYLSFLAIGLLLIILRDDISSDLKQALFFILGTCKNKIVPVFLRQLPITR
jgi:hypothetical protein